MSLVVSFDQPEAGLASLVGGKGMNLIILTAAGFTSVRIKFLLPLPALTTFAGTCAGLWLAQ